MTSTVITARAGREPDPGPFRGVSHWLRLELYRWLIDVLRPDTRYEDTVALHRVIARLKIPAASWSNEISAWSPIDGWLYEDREGERLLDVIHVVIQARPGVTDYVAIDQILSDGGSAYRATPRGIEHRVDPTAQEAFEAAIRSRDHASNELAEAWRRRTGGTRTHPTHGITRSRPSRLSFVPSLPEQHQGNTVQRHR